MAERYVIRAVPIRETRQPTKASYTADELPEALADLEAVRQTMGEGYRVELVKIIEDGGRVETTPLLDTLTDPTGR